MLPLELQHHVLWTSMTEQHQELTSAKALVGLASFSSGSGGWLWQAEYKHGSLRVAHSHMIIAHTSHWYAGCATGVEGQLGKNQP